MATVVNPNLYAGKNRKDLLKPAIYGGDTVLSGLWQVIPTVKSKFTYTLFGSTDTLVSGNGCANTVVSANTLADKEIDTVRYKQDVTMCKDDLRGSYFEDDLMAALDVKITNDIARNTRQLENIRWSGDTASAVAALAHQDGVVKILVTAGTFIPVSGALAANILDPTKVIAELNKVLAVVPADILYNPNFKLIMSPAVFAAFRQAAYKDGNYQASLNVARMATNIDPTRGAVGYFMDYPIYIAIGLDAITTAPSTKANAHVVLAGIFSNGEEGNLKMTTDLIGEQGEIKVLDLEPTTGDEKFRLVYDFKQGLDVAKPNEIVMYR